MHFYCITHKIVIISQTSCFFSCLNSLPNLTYMQVCPKLYAFAYIFVNIQSYRYNDTPFQVTYSQLDLGENNLSYNNRQSNPNIRGEIIRSGATSGGTSSKSDWGRRHSESHVPRKSWASAKSAPATPRAGSPSRSRKSTYSSGIGSNQYPYQGQHKFK